MLSGVSILMWEQVVVWVFLVLNILADPWCNQFWGKHEYGMWAKLNGSFIFSGWVGQTSPLDVLLSTHMGRNKKQTTTTKQRNVLPWNKLAKKDELGFLPELLVDSLAWFSAFTFQNLHPAQCRLEGTAKLLNWTVCLCAALCCGSKNRNLSITQSNISYWSRKEKNTLYCKYIRPYIHIFEYQWIELFFLSIPLQPSDDFFLTTEMHQNGYGISISNQPRCKDKPSACSPNWQHYAGATWDYSPAVWVPRSEKKTNVTYATFVVCLALNETCSKGGMKTFLPRGLSRRALLCTRSLYWFPI